MATVQNTYTGDGSQTNFSFTFEYFEEADVKVALDNVDQATTEYSFANATTISFNTAPASNVAIRIYRQTSVDDPKAQFFAGSAIRADDLNDNNTQVRYLAQEVENAALSRFGKNNAAADINMGGNRITNLKDVYTNSEDENAADADDAASHGWVRKFFFDVKAETVDTSEYDGANPASWPNDNQTVATTGAITEYLTDQLTSALNDKVHGADGINVADNTPAAGNITIGISQGSVDLDRIKPEDINTSTETVYGYANNVPTVTGTDWTVTDDQVATLKAIAKRHDGIVQNNAPSGTDYLPGTVWLSESGSSDTLNSEGEQLTKYLAVWNGNEWVGVAGGGTWINQNSLIWVDAGNGDDTNDGHRVIVPMKTIQGAVNKAEDGDMIFVQPGVYTEYLPIDLGRKKNVSIIGLSMRSVFVHPHPTKKWNVTTAGAADSITNKVMEAGAHGNATSGTSEYETMFQLGSGSFVANMSLAGMKASGARGDLHTDSEAAQQGWFFAFADNDGAGNAVKFQKSPYIQNCTAFADSAIDNTNYQPHSTVNQPAFGGDQTSAPTGGALLVDGSVPHPDSPLRSFLTDAYTLICLDGPGVLVRNEGYAQLVSTFGHFCHYHAKAESGGMINMSNCTTDFGRFGLVADGQSVDSIFEGTVSATSTNNVIQIDATTAWTERNNNTPKPVNHMVVSLINNPSSASDYYPIKNVTEPSAGVYNIELYNNVSVTNDQTVYFYLRSLITTGGHVFEFVGSGTDYRAHPDSGGSPVEANQVKNEGAGKVYISSSDSNGNFKVGEVFNVSTDGASVTITGNASVSGTLDATNLTVNGSAVNSSSTYFDSNGDIKDTAMPDKVTAGTSAYPSSVTVDTQGRVTAISAGTEPVTSVTAASGSAVSVTATKTPEVDIATFAGSSQKGIVVNDGTAGNDSKYLKGDGTWADVTSSVGLSAAQDGSNANLVLERTAGNDTVKFAAGTGIDITVSGSSGSEQILIEAPTRVNAQVHISDTIPTSGVAHGDLYFDFATGESYLYYDESLAIDSSTSQAVGSDAQWIQFAPQQRGTGNGTVTSIQVTGGTGLSVDNGSAVVTSGSYQVSLDDTAVTAAQYGTSSAVPQFTVDQQGRITAATDVNIGSLDAAAVSSGTFDAARIPSFNASKIQYTFNGTETDAWNATNQEFIAAVIPDIDPSTVKYDVGGTPTSIWDSNNSVFYAATIPTLSKSKISSTGTWASSDIPDLSATYLTAVSADTSPSLGGSLDVNGNSIVSTSDGNITLNPNGTGVVSFANATGTTYTNGNYGVTIKPPTLSADLSLVLPGFSVVFPATDGTAGQYLKTDGAGNLGWGTNTTYSLAGADDSGDFRIRLSDGSTDNDVKLKAGTGVTLDNSTANECTISVSAVPTGAIMWWTNTTLPTGWLECKGQALSRTDAAYNALKLTIGNTFAAHRDITNFPLATYPETDYFTVPDLRGEFIRGLDSNRGIDNGRVLGTAQSDNVKQHSHSYTVFQGQIFNAGPPGTATAGTTSPSTTGSYPVTAGTPDETRPRNIAMIAIIKT